MPITSKLKLEDITIDLSSRGLGPWSYSKLKVLHRCPFQFYLKYIIKAKPTVAEAEHQLTTTGKIAHAILEKILMGKSVEEAFKETKLEYPSVTESDWEERVSTLEFNIQKFKERIDAFSVENPVKAVHQELRIGIKEDLSPCDFFDRDVWFRGVVDLALSLKSGDVIFLDHKTGATALSGLKYFKDQLNTYKVLYHNGIEKVLGAQAGVHFVKEGEILMGEYSPVKEIETILTTNFKYDIECAVDKVKDLGYFKHISWSGCQWCDFRIPCKGKQLKDVEAKTVKFFKK